MTLIITRCDEELGVHAPVCTPGCIYYHPDDYKAEMDRMLSALDASPKEEPSEFFFSMTHGRIDKPISQEVSVMDDNQKLFTELLVAEVGRLRDQVEFLQQQAQRDSTAIDNLQDMLHRAEEENTGTYERMSATIAAMEDSNWDLRERLRPYQEQERQQKLKREQEEIQQRLAATYKNVDPVSMLPNAKGWTQKRKAKLVRETAAKLPELGYIPTIKWVREHDFGSITIVENAEGFAYQQPNLGLKQAKDFVDCVRSKEVS